MENRQLTHENAGLGCIISTFPQDTGMPLHCNFFSLFLVMGPNTEQYVLIKFWVVIISYRIVTGMLSMLSADCPFLDIESKRIRIKHRGIILIHVDQSPRVSCDLSACPRRDQAQSFDHGHTKGHVKWRPTQRNDVAFHPPELYPNMRVHHTQK